MNDISDYKLEIKNTKNQIRLIEVYCQQWNTIILSGAFKVLKIKPDEMKGEFTDEQKLQNAVSNLEIQVTNLANFIQSLNELNAGLKKATDAYYAQFEKKYVDGNI